MKKKCYSACIREELALLAYFHTLTLLRVPPVVCPCGQIGVQSAATHVASVSSCIRCLHAWHIAFQLCCMSECLDICCCFGAACLLQLPLRARVEAISFSAHADFDQTRQFLEQLAPPHVVLVHGEFNEMMRLRTVRSTARTAILVIILHPLLFWNGRASSAWHAVARGRTRGCDGGNSILALQIHVTSGGARLNSAVQTAVTQHCALHPQPACALPRPHWAGANEKV